MTTYNNLRPLSKFLSFLLRHGADEFQLELDEEGFASLDEVWAIVEKRYRGRYTLEDLEPVLEGRLDGKKRLAREGDRIRAVYGHNRKTRQIQYDPANPPVILYHGTNERVLGKIHDTGLLPMERQYVHLSVDRERAFSVARRSTKNPVMLEVRAQDAQAHGLVFFQPDANHFLCEAIPAEFLNFPQS